MITAYPPGLSVRTQTPEILKLPWDVSLIDLADIKVVVETYFEKSFETVVAPLMKVKMMSYSFSEGDWFNSQA